MYQEKMSHFGHRPVKEEEPCGCLKQNAKAANYTYRIYSNKQPWPLFNFSRHKCGAYLNTVPEKITFLVAYN